MKRLCVTTDEKIDGLTDEELRAHVREVEGLMGRTGELLQYWVKRREGAVREKEAFEGVIENLVRHARGGGGKGIILSSSWFSMWDVVMMRKENSAQHCSQDVPKQLEKE